MELRLERTLKAKATVGKLYVDGTFECFTLEDPVRDLGPNGEGKIPGDTAIPAGRYRVVINLSPRFGKLMIRLLEVAFFTGILMHGGNTTVDTHGCILVGDELKGETIRGGTSTPAIRRLFAKVKAALDRGESVWITITNGAAQEGI